MKFIRFTITEEEIRDVAGYNLSDDQVKILLEMVECDEMLWKDIHNSIVWAINELQLPNVRLVAKH